MEPNPRHADGQFEVLTGTLAPCPFCGGSAGCGYADHHPESEAAKLSGRTRFFFINCIVCGARTTDLVGHNTAKEAAAAWNKRATAPAGETTSPEVARLAAGILGGGPYVHADVLTLAGSALTNAADRAAVAPMDAAPVAGEAERLLAALGAADADLRRARAGDGYIVYDDDGTIQSRAETPLAALRAAFPEVASAAPSSAGEAGR